MSDFVDVFLPSVSGTIATGNMTGKPLLGFSGAEGGGFENTWLDTPETKEKALDFLYNITNALEHNDNKHVDKEATTKDHNSIIGPGDAPLPRAWLWRGKLRSSEQACCVLV